MGEFLQTMAIWSYEIMAISWWMIEQTYRTLLHKLKWMEHITSYHVVFDVHNNHLPKKLVMENKEYNNRMSKLIIACAYADVIIHHSRPSLRCSFFL